MKVFQIIILASFLFFCSPGFAKPQKPVSISFTSPDLVLIGEPVNFTVTVISKIDAEKLQISVQPPMGMILVSGELNWRGQVKGYQPVIMNFTAILPENSHFIAAQVAIKSSGSSRFMDRTVLHYRKSTVLKKEVARPGVRFNRGRRIIEYPVNSNR